LTSPKAPNASASATSARPVKMSSSVSRPWLPNRFGTPKTSATTPMTKMLIMSAPKTLPSARLGFCSSHTAEMFTVTSGSDVAMPTSSVPTQSLPQPVASARSSPKRARPTPAAMTKAELTRNTRMAPPRVSMVLR
jgi:hypothetical protein